MFELLSFFSFSLWQQTSHKTVSSFELLPKQATCPVILWKPFFLLKPALGTQKALSNSSRFYLNASQRVGVSFAQHVCVEFLWKLWTFSEVLSFFCGENARWPERALPRCFGRQTGFQEPDFSDFNLLEPAGLGLWRHQSGEMLDLGSGAEPRRGSARPVLLHPGGRLWRKKPDVFSR